MNKYKAHVSVTLVGGEKLRKSSAVFIILALTIAILALACFNNYSVKASSNFSVQSVSHSVGVFYNGYVLVNDTIAASGQTDSFLIGFPHSFGPSVVSVIAYSTDNPAETFPVTLNVPFENHVGFFGVSIDFSKGTPQVFSVVFVLSDSFQELNSTIFQLVFPTFPSLTVTAPVCNCSVTVPEATYVNGTVSSFAYDAENLNAFTYNTSQVDLLVPAGDYQVFDIQQLSRDVTIDAFGHVSVSDVYYVTNNSTSEMNSMDFILPLNASNVVANDQVGIPPITPPPANSNSNRYTINFTLEVDPGQTIKFTVTYDLPDNVYVVKQGGNFAFNMSFFQDTISYIDQASVNFFLPQGARLSNFQTTLSGNLYGVNRDVYQDSMSVSEQNVIPLDSFTVDFSYSYNPLWLALGPTLWVFVFALLGSGFVAIWKRPRAPSGVVLPSMIRGGGALHPEDYSAFADAYEEKMKIENEIDALDERVQKGRIPRRRYKVQKKTLETRLDALDRTLEELGGKMHLLGGHFADMMRQLEFAETEIDEAESSISSIEARQGRGEISLETYRKLRANYEHRKDRAKTTIRGILLRLREETY